MPWCIRKCPYCDFNSHELRKELPEAHYIDMLLADLAQDIETYGARPLISIFIGGGTPSLFSATAYAKLFAGIHELLPLSNSIEITLEANPGTVEYQRFADYHAIGINRLSLGIQSFNDEHLHKLGRIHNATQAQYAIEYAYKAGIQQLNLDLMHGLPSQSVVQGLHDLTIALSHTPTHISWYQLTLEPNTVFYKTQPPLPAEDELAELEEQGFTRLANAGYQRYEISAFSQPGCQAQHNLNYWKFGDYYGIGAGAHGKLSKNGQVYRTRKHRQPHDYLNPSKTFTVGTQVLAESDLIFEFMLNATRLEEPISLNLFTERTGLLPDVLIPQLQLAASRGLIKLDSNTWRITPFGRRYTNDLQALFLG